VISENTARFAGGKTMTQRYYNIIHPIDVPQRSSQEIIESISKQLDAIGKGKEDEDERI